MDYYRPQPQDFQQYPTPQHYSTGIAPGQNHAQPTATHSSHWNNDYNAVAQQSASANTQPRRPPQQNNTTYAYRPPPQLQADPSGTAALTMGRTGQTPMMAQGPQGPPLPPQLQELPLRMVVEAKYVGAIIGQGGGNIREISKDSKARCVVDVQRAMRDQDGIIEKVISIGGQPENCTKACMKVLEVIQRELEKEEPEKTNGEVTLKLRAHNQLVGRLIGKQGSTIKKIMQDTNSTIFVSNSEPASQMSASMPPMFDLLQMERTITVRAPTIQDVSNAEQRISAKLRQSFEIDIANRLQQFPGGYPMPGMLPSMVNPIGDAYAMSGMNLRNNLQGNITKTVRMYVPNNMVGAIIGTKGSNIRQIMRNSGAQVKIDGGERRIKEGMDPEEIEREKEREREEREKNPEEERLVTITGNDSQQCRAQFWIYQRVAEQTSHNIEDVKLRTEIQVPAKLVGRIIGKGGQNVRELQRITGAQVDIVKIPDENEEGAAAGGAGAAENPTPAEGEDSGSNAPTPVVRKESGDDESCVRIVANFQSSISVQLRISHVCAEFQRLSNLNDRRERYNKDDRDEDSEQPEAENVSTESPEATE
ncbi:unnamed protein product, partial [Mesorhabditis spiculigera]